MLSLMMLWLEKILISSDLTLIQLLQMRETTTVSFHDGHSWAEYPHKIAKLCVLLLWWRPSHPQKSRITGSHDSSMFFFFFFFFFGGGGGSWRSQMKRIKPISYGIRSYQETKTPPMPMTPVGWFNINITSYQYEKSHCGDKTILRSSYLHNWISYTSKTTSLYWIGVLEVSPHSSESCFSLLTN